MFLRQVELFATDGIEDNENVLVPFDISNVIVIEDNENVLVLFYIFNVIVMLSL